MNDALLLLRAHAWAPLSIIVMIWIYRKEAALAQFMAQQHTRWEQIQRTLGRIEGFLDKGADDGFPRRR